MIRRRIHMFSAMSTHNCRIKKLGQCTPLKTTAVSPKERQQRFAGRRKAVLPHRKELEAERFSVAAKIWKKSKVSCEDRRLKIFRCHHEDVIVHESNPTQIRGVMLSIFLCHGGPKREKLKCGCAGVKSYRQLQLVSQIQVFPHVHHVLLQIKLRSFLPNSRFREREHDCQQGSKLFIRRSETGDFFMKSLEEHGLPITSSLLRPMPSKIPTYTKACSFLLLFHLRHCLKRENSMPPVHMHQLRTVP